MANSTSNPRKDNKKARMNAIETETENPEPDGTKGEIRTQSFFDTGTILYEQIYRAGQFLFLEYDTRTCQTSEVERINCDHGLIIEPFKGEEIKQGAIILPSGIAEYGDTEDLLERLRDFVRQYLDISEIYLRFSTYYVLLSWVYDRLPTVPYLRPLGDTGCGKSRLLDTIGRLCYKPIIVSGAVTPAPIYRLISRYGGTLVLDEADLKNSDEYNEVITILNCGFERGRPVVRCVPNNPQVIEFLPTFGPKVFATRRRFKDPALEARCLTEVMRETSRSDIPALLTPSFFREQEELRNMLLLFRFRNWDSIDLETEIDFDLGDIEPRLKQIAVPFGAVLAQLDGVREDFTTLIRVHQKELIEQRSATPAGYIIEALFELLGDEAHVTLDSFVTATGLELLPISPQDIAERVDMDARKVGQIMRGLGLKTERGRVQGEQKRLIVSDPDLLTKLRRRYLASEEPCDKQAKCDKDIEASRGKAKPRVGSNKARTAYGEQMLQRIRTNLARTDAETRRNSWTTERKHDRDDRDG